VIRRVVASTPGKLILMGEHAAVYGQPALVAAVDPRARVEAAVGTRGLQVALADLDLALETTWDDVVRHADRCRQAWLRYAADPTPEHFSAVSTGSPEDLVMVALGELAALIDPPQRQPLTVKVESCLPIGSGFGSSASIAVALLGAVLTLLHGGADEESLDHLAFEIERRQHGLPSGVDHQTVLHGGVVVATRSPGGGLVVSRLASRPPELGDLHVYQTGKPHETTGEVVAAVRRRRDSDPSVVNALLERMGRDVLDLRSQLEMPDRATARTVDLIRDYESCLEVLGVVPVEVQEVIREVEAAGGAAKISGAGTLTGAAAGCLLVYWPSGAPAQPPAPLEQYRRLAVELGVEGLRVEELR
jgi:mevalonate kinase